MRPFVLALLTAVLVALPARAAEPVVKHATFALGKGQRVQLEFPIGGLQVEPSPDGKVHVELRLRCDDDRAACQQRAGEIEVVSESRLSALKVKLDRWPPRWNPLGLHMETHVLVPAAAPLEISMGAGDVSVRGHASDLDVQVGVGDATLQIGRADMRRARLEVGVGEARLRNGDETIGGQGGLGHIVDWDRGKGRSTLHARVGVGRIEVELQ